jgi:hypothetical protein
MLLIKAFIDPMCRSQWASNMSDSKWRIRVGMGKAWATFLVW